MESNFITFSVLQPQLTQLQSQPYIHSLPWEANSGSYFSRTIFQPSPKETAKYHCFALSLSILHAHFRMKIW